MTSLRIALLGPLRASFDGEPQRPPKRRDTERLWAYLLLHRGEVLDRAAVADALWPESATARSTLRQSLHELRRHLPPVPADQPWLLVEHDRIGWNTAAPYALDLDGFERVLRSRASDSTDRKRDRGPDLESRQHAIEHYSGALLEGMDEPWLVAERERLERLYRTALTDLARDHLAAGDPTAALSAARRLVAHDPFHEASQRLLIQLYLETGDRAAALSQFDACRALLAAELDVEPEAETTALAEAIRAGIAVPTAPAVTPRLDDATPPVFAGSLVGAQRVRELTGRLASTGLLTVTGPPGSGKSRLAAEAARLARAELPGGLWWVDLAPLGPDDEVAAAVARAIGGSDVVEGGAGGSAGGGIEAGGHAAGAAGEVAALIARQSGAAVALLVLDNAERVATGCAVLLREIMPALPQLRIWATSRERIGVGAEAVWRVPLLGVPGSGTLGGGADLPEAAALFLGLAETYRPGLILTADRAAAVAAIARASEGLPDLLARAAAALAGQELLPLAAELRAGEYGGLDRTGPVPGLRHASWTAAVAWSEDRLPLLQRALFRRLAVFDGGFDATAAERLCASDAGGGVDVPADEVLDLLDRLVAGSLVVSDVNAPAGARHRLLDPLRWYARARLAESGEAAELARRLAALKDDGDEIVPARRPGTGL